MLSVITVVGPLQAAPTRVEVTARRCTCHSMTCAPSMHGNAELRGIPTPESSA